MADLTVAEIDGTIDNIGKAILTAATTDERMNLEVARADLRNIRKRTAKAEAITANKPGAPSGV